MNSLKLRALSALFLAACGNSNAIFDDTSGAGGDDHTAGVGPSGVGGGASDGGGGNSEGGGEPTGVGGNGGHAPACIPSTVACEGTVLVQCDENGNASEEDCAIQPGGDCVLGRCEHSLLALMRFDEGSGSTTSADLPAGMVGDMGTVQWDGTLTSGSAAYFLGNHEVDFGDVLNGISLPFTVSAWVRTTTELSLMTVVATNSRPGGNYSGIWLNVDGANGRTVVVGFGNNLGTAASNRHGKRSSAAVPPNQWTHVAAVVTGPDNASIYIDGVEAGGSYSGTASFVSSDEAPLLVGRSFWGLASMKGAIDNIRIYGRALTHSEVIDLHTLEAP